MLFLWSTFQILSPTGTTHIFKFQVHIIVTIEETFNILSFFQLFSFPILSSQFNIFGSDHKINLSNFFYSTTTIVQVSVSF